jgi:hypothetical protein
MFILGTQVKTDVAEYLIEQGKLRIGIYGHSWLKIRAVNILSGLLLKQLQQFVSDDSQGFPQFQNRGPRTQSVALGFCWQTLCQ